MYFWLSCLAAGLCLCLLICTVAQPLSREVADAPAWVARSLARALWPWIFVLSKVCAPFVSWGQRARIERIIKHAGMDQSWKAEHVMAVYCLAFIAGSAMGGATALMVFQATIASAILIVVLAGMAAAILAHLQLRDRVLSRQRAILRMFPFLLDMTTLCVEAGLNLQGALNQAARHGPEGPLRHEIEHALADMRAGVARIDSLRRMAQRIGLTSVDQLVAALSQAEQLGMSLGPLLRAQAEQQRTERFLRAEKLALQAPVKMLIPMVLCIFPCTFLVIGFPIVTKLTQGGL